MKKLKKSYTFLLVIAIIGIIMGILFSNILSSNDQKMVYTRITNFFNDLKDDNPLDYTSNLIEIIRNHGMYILIISLLSLSVIGLVLNNFILFIKAFIMGFTIGSIINTYFYAGIVLSIFYIFPVQLFNLLLYAVLIYYANILSMRIYENIFHRKEHKFFLLIKTNLKVIGICNLLFIFSTLFEVYLTPHILRMFCFLIE